MSGCREIGGYLELERFSGPMMHEGDIALNCGRACLEYLIELRGIRMIWLPDFLCSSVPDLCRKVDVDVKTYRIEEGFRPAYDFEVANGEWLYLVDYYGQLSQDDVDTALEASNGCLIVDESQGYYRPPWKGADTLYTCRKWFGVADGAFLHTSDGARIGRQLPRSESFDKMGFVLGRFERPAGVELPIRDMGRLAAPLISPFTSAGTGTNFSRGLPRRRYTRQFYGRLLLRIF